MLAAFEDSTTGTRVKEFCQGLSLDLGSGCRVVERAWLFNTFRFRELQEIAAEEASESDLVIISTHRAERLPDEVRGWIDLWLRQGAKRAAILVALLDPDYEGASGEAETYLQEVASRWGMEFLVISAEAADAR